MADPVPPADVEALIAAFEQGGCTELHVRFDGFELHLSNDPDAATLTAAPAAAMAAPAAGPDRSRLSSAAAAATPQPPATIAPADDLSAL